MSDVTEDWYSPLKLNLFFEGICWAAVFVESYNSVKAIWFMMVEDIPAAANLVFNVFPKGSTEEK